MAAIILKTKATGQIAKPSELMAAAFYEILLTQ